MRKYLIYFLLMIIVCGCLLACSEPSSSFSIQFIDVGQGDAALVECDGHHMLIDGGDTSAGDKVYNVLEEQGIQHLDILALSHRHDDHVGGLAKTLTYATSKITISNTTEGETKAFKEFKRQLEINKSKLSIPHAGDKYKLGSAEVEVVDASSQDNNDSLVLLVTYKKTKYLFTGDIGEKTQSRIADQYSNEADEPFKINLLKMPHHGGAASIQFIRTFMPDYAIISVGKNQYDHPNSVTLERIEQVDAKMFRTDKDGDITVKSDGERITVKTSK